MKNEKITLSGVIAGVFVWVIGFAAISALIGPIFAAIAVWAFWKYLGTQGQ